MWKRWSFILVPIVGGLLCLLLRDGSVHFTDIHHAKASIEEAGFACVGDRRDGTVGNGFIVSREPIDWFEANELWKAGPMGPAWKDKLWVAKASRKLILETTPGDKPPHMWGNVLAFGDQEFLVEVEQALLKRIGGGLL